MKTIKPLIKASLLSVIFSAILVATSSVQALPPPTFWTGPATNFNSPGAGALSDVIVPGVVVFSRGSRKAIYNSAQEANYNAAFSPKDTLWAIGTIDQATNLTYDIADNVLGGPGNSPQQSVGTTFVVHLTNENIYLELTLTNWGSGTAGDSSFGYSRTTPAAQQNLSVSITNPTNGAEYAAPASVNLQTSTSGGTVTNVQFFNGATSLGSVTGTPFNFTASGLSAGSYSFSAVASAGGNTATSSVVNVTVVDPLPIQISSPTVPAANKFVFSYTANPGLTYIVQRSTAFSGWQAILTNIPTSSPVSVTDVISSTQMFYRVGRLPNP